MNRHNKAHRPRTPLLIVLLGVSIFVAAVSFVNVELTNHVLETVATAALVVVTGIQHIALR